jgi:beta-glucosidase
VHDPIASISRPLLELKGVRRIALASGERGNVSWQLPVSSLAFLGADLEAVVEPGRFEIYAGLSAQADGLLGCSIEVVP